MRRARARLTDDEHRSRDHLLGDPGMLLAVVHEAQSFDEDAREHPRRAVLHRAFDVGVVVERVDQHVEGLEEQHVAEVVEAAGAGGLVEQLVTDDHRRIMP